MAWNTGFVFRTKSKEKIHTLMLSTAGGLMDSVTGVTAKPVGSIKTALAVTATANTDFTLTVPKGASVKDMIVYTTTGFGAVTDAKISVGVSAGDQTYVAQATIKALGIYPLTLASGSSALGNAPTPPNLFVRITQTGTASATGAALLVVTYVFP